MGVFRMGGLEPWVNLLGQGVRWPPPFGLTKGKMGGFSLARDGPRGAFGRLLKEAGAIDDLGDRPVGFERKVAPILGSGGREHTRPGRSSGRQGHRKARIFSVPRLCPGWSGAKWGWLTAVGLTPILISLAPCAAMCGLGLCMKGGTGKGCGKSTDTPSTE